MYVFSVAFRYLIRRVMSWICIAIIALIIILYMLIMSVMEGFKNDHMTLIRAAYAHMNVRAANSPEGIIKPEAWAEALKEIEGIKAVTISMETPALVLFDKGKSTCSLKGIDLETEIQHGKLGEQLEPKIEHFGVHAMGGAQVHGCAVPQAWKSMFDLKIGDQVTFIFGGQSDDESDIPFPIAFKLVSFVDAGTGFQSNTAFVDRKKLSKEMGYDGKAKTLSLWVEGDPDRKDLNQIREKVIDRTRVLFAEEQQKYPGEKNASYREYLAKLKAEVSVETWREKFQNLYYAIKRENQIMRFIMAIFLVFVVIIIALILGQVAAEKVRDIGILRAMGATPSGIRACFITQGMIIALLGILIGLPLAWLCVTYVNELESGISWLIMKVSGMNFRVFPPEDFLSKKIPSNWETFDQNLIVTLTFLAGFLGALIPSFRASRANPVECLRHE